MHPILKIAGVSAGMLFMGVPPSQAQAGESAVAPGIVTKIKVQPDRAPDCTSLKAIAETVTRDAKNNDAKAIAIYNFMQLSHYHNNYPSESRGISVLKEINCYGWSLCGGLHAEQSALWNELGWGWRFVGWSNPGHTTVEAQYDGRWHYLDVFLKFYGWMPDGKGGRTIAGQDDLSAQAQTLVKEAFVMDKGRGCVYAKDNQFVIQGDKANWGAPPFLVCGDSLSGVMSGLKSKRLCGSPSNWAGMNHATGNYSADVNLGPGFCLENSWDPMTNAWYWAKAKKPPEHSCGGHKDTRNEPGIGMVLEPYVDAKPKRSYANGTLSFEPDFSNDAFLRSFVSVDNVKYSKGALVPAETGKPASLVLNLKTPYILTLASGEAVGADTVEVSVDGGKTFTGVDIKDFSASVKGSLEALVKITLKDALTALNIKAVFQNNPGALPYLSPGKNRVTVSVEDPKALGANTLVVTYAYRSGSRTKSFEQLCEQGKEIAKQHNAKWSGTINYVQKTFLAKDLPATFDIDCPTPKGAYPVYPRMVFLRREVITPGSKPFPLPTGAIEAKEASAQELQTLPNPFLMGSEIPEVAKPRKVRTLRIPLNYGQFVNESGEAAAKGSLKWPKSDDEIGKVPFGVVTMTGSLGEVAVKSIAGARLLVPISKGYNRTGCKLGVVMLPPVSKEGKAYDVAKLPDPIGTGVIPKQPADTPEYKPAKVFAIDVTRGIKAVLKGDVKFNGFGVRVLPDRGVDDGYTVWCDVSSVSPIVLEVDVYADAPTPQP